MADDKAKKEATEKDAELIINDTTKEAPKESESSTSEPETSDKVTNEPLDDTTDKAKELVDPSPAAEPAPKKHKFVWTRKKIILVSIAVFVLTAGILAAVPVTRYAIAGVFIKRDFTVTLRDSKTDKPVSNVAVDIENGQSTVTDAKGVATFKSIPVGAKKITIHKKYYKNFTATQTIGITGDNPSFDFDIEATGRQVPVRIINKISQQPVEGADVTADGTSSKTDKNGEATIVLPADKSTMPATITQNGYNKANATVTITEQQDDKNTFAIVPTGKLYFLSKRSGTIDVLKSDLDGGNVETVLKGTGKEEDRNTILLASRDWKYLGLLSSRDGDKAKVYVISTATGKLATVDEGDAYFELKGWSGQHLIYTVSRSNVKSWESKRTALKSYNATSTQLNTLDETSAVGNQNDYAAQSFEGIYILDNLLVYTRVWYGSTDVASGQHPDLASVEPDGKNKQTVKSFANGYGLDIKSYEPQEIYLRTSHWEGGQPKYEFYEYEDGQVKTADISDEEFSKFYPTYLVSPSGTSTFWYEPRDGKNTLFVGDKAGHNEKEIVSLSEYKSYGWYSDDYLLASKAGSELYIISRSNPGAAPLKVTDYHKPQIDFYGYGYGYGGF